MSKHLIKQAEQFVGANIDVTMGALKSIQIFVLGDVKRPGAYTIGSFATITDALLIAGGPAGIGTMRNIQLRRKDKIITTFDLYDLLLKGDKSKDTILQAGDVVFVPVAGPDCRYRRQCEKTRHLRAQRKSMISIPFLSLRAVLYLQHILSRFRSKEL